MKKWRKREFVFVSFKNFPISTPAFTYNFIYYSIYYNYN